MKLIPLAEFRKRYFDAESAPDMRTLRAWMRAGAVPGRIIEVGSRCEFWVDRDQWERIGGTGNQIADGIIQALDGSQKRAA